jgi:integrase
VKGRSNRKAAWAAWHKLRAAGGEEQKERRRDAKVGEVVREFLKDAEGRVKPNTFRLYRYFLQPLAAKHGKLMASDMAPTKVEAFSRRLEWSATTRSDFLGAVVSAFKWAVRARLISSNPIAGVQKPPKASRGAKALISWEEHQRLLAAATPCFQPFLVVLRATGARPAEVAGITAENADLEAGIVRLEEHKTSHRGHSRTLYLTPEAVELLSSLRERYQTGPLLRTRFGRGWYKQMIVRAMAKARERAGVPRATAYGYRHTFCTDALCSGVPDGLVAELVGHRGTATLHRNYNHLYARGDALKAALNQVRG